MGVPVVMIDFENIQPKMLHRLVPGEFRIKVFLGQNQSKLALELVQALQPLGSDVHYVPIQGSGRDAADFHIAFYLGLISAEEPGTRFIIVSGDGGYDPLIRHLAGRGIDCRRLPEMPRADPDFVSPNPSLSAPSPSQATSVSVLPQPAPVAKSSAKKTSAAVTSRTRAKEVAAILKKSTKPATVEKLRSSIKSWIKPAPDEKAIDAILQSLQDSKLVKVAGTKVSYTLG